MIQDLHAHTYYSFDSGDSPEKVVQRAIAEGVDMLGITDHNFGIACAREEFYREKGARLYADYGKTLVRYYDHISALKEKYAKKIKLLCGIEVCTMQTPHDSILPYTADISFFDFALIEGLDNPTSITHGDIFSFAKRCACPVGIAHTDMFSFIASIGEEPNRYFRRMAEQGIFWEINVNYDSMHNFKTYDYVTEFFKNKAQQEIVRNAKVKLSVGFDSHILQEYKAQKVKNACNLIKSMGIPLAFEHR